MNSNKPFLFSIITPVYNRADCIIRCLESIHIQDFCSYELIVINDGSTDNTLEKIESYASQITNLKLVSYSNNKGVNYARNRGIEQAEGEFIIFLDSDDTFTSEALTVISNTINDCCDYPHYLFGVSDRVDDSTLPVRMHEYQFKDWLSGNVSGDFVHVIKPCCFKDLFFIEEFRIYEELNWLRVLRGNKKQLFVPTVVSNREREREDSVTRESNLDSKKNMQNTYDFICYFTEWYSEDYNSLGLSNKLQSQVKKGYLLGLALGETSRNIHMINQMECSSTARNFYKLLNKASLNSIFFRLIQTKSRYNQLMKN